MVDSLVLIGASGRVGSLVRAAWQLAPPGLAVTYQFRPASAVPASDDVLFWDPLSQPPPARLRSAGGEATMVVLAGVTPASGASLDANTEIAMDCLAAARNMGIRRVLIASSSAVYGPGTGHPIAETYEPAGFNAYGAAKLAMEAAVLEAAGEIEVCCLRIGNVLGADALLLNARNVTPDNPLLLDQFADGQGPMRSYIDPRTLADVLASLAVAEGPLPPVLNIASPRPVSMQSIAEGAGIAWRWRPASPAAHQTIVLDCSAAQAIYSFDPDDNSPTLMLARLNQVRPRT